jgi:hypothetical protein
VLELQRWLTLTEALSWMNERQDFTEPPGTIDADPFVVASGYGAALLRHDPGNQVNRPSGR